MNEYITVMYENPDTHEEFKQIVELEEDIVDRIYLQMLNYQPGNEIPVDSPLYYLFTAIRYISKLQGFERTPNFNIIPPEEVISAWSKKS